MIDDIYFNRRTVPLIEAYINAGYEDEGILINFSCSKKKL